MLQVLLPSMGISLVTCLMVLVGQPPQFYYVAFYLSSAVFSLLLLSSSSISIVIVSGVSSSGYSITSTAVITFTTLLVITVTVFILPIRLIIDMGLRFWVDWCKKGGGTVTIITHSWGLRNITVSVRISGNIIGFKFFSLRGGNMSWDVSPQQHSW